MSMTRAQFLKRLVGAIVGVKAVLMAKEAVAEPASNPLLLKVESAPGVDLGPNVPGLQALYTIESVERDAFGNVRVWRDASVTHALVVPHGPEDRSTWISFE